MHKEIKNDKKMDVSFFDALILLVVLISFYSLSFLSFHDFSVNKVWSFSIATFVCVAFLFRDYFSFSKKIFYSQHIILIFILIIIALCFRYAPYLYVIGGQDEGVYVNMSKVYEKSGAVFQTDSVRQGINDKSVLEIYDNENLILRNNKIPGKYEGGYLPGVYISNNEQSERVFQFYHLHPLWMAIAGQLFGDQNRVFSLVFFSLISIIAFYLLAYELSDNQFIAFLSGLLLAINPLHAFFSKFPVTEVMALAFSSTGFYYLLKFYLLSKKKIYISAYLILSCFALAAMFFTRISGFLYLPFFLILIVLTRFYVSDSETRNRLFVYFLFVFGFYILSVYYGLIFSYPYSHDIYNISFAKLFGHDWHGKLLISLIFLMILLMVILINPKSQFVESLKKINTHLLNFAPYFFLLIITIGFYKIYQLGFTDKYIGHYWLDKTFPMAARGWLSIFYSSLVVTVEYLSPFIVVLFFISLFRFRSQGSNPELNAVLLVFLFGFCVYIALLQWTVPYHYYYARYLLTEVVPYTLLFVLVNCFKKEKKVFGNNFQTYSIILAGFYFVFFSALQLQGKETDGAYESLKKISNRVENDSLILLDKSHFGYRANELKTALVYYFGKNVFSFSTKEQLNVINNSSNIKAQYNKIYVFSDVLYESNDFSYMEQLQYQQGNFAKSGVIPMTFSYQKIPVYLYQLK